MATTGVSGTAALMEAYAGEESQMLYAGQITFEQGLASQLPEPGKFAQRSRS